MTFTIPDGADMVIAAVWKDGSNGAGFVDDIEIFEKTQTPEKPTAPVTAGNELGATIFSSDFEEGTLRQFDRDAGGMFYSSGKSDVALSSEQAQSGNYSVKLHINTESTNGNGIRQTRWREPSDGHKDLIYTVYMYFPQRIGLDPKNDWFNIANMKGVKFAPGGREQAQIR